MGCTGSPRTTATSFGVPRQAISAHIAAASADHLSPFVRFAAITTTGNAVLRDQPFWKNLVQTVVAEANLAIRWNFSDITVKANAVHIFRILIVKQ